MFNSRARITVAALTIAAFSAGVTSVASAAIAIRGPGTATPVVAAHPITAALQAGSAGIAGYDDAKCESLANDYNTAVSRAEDALLRHDDADVDTYTSIARLIRGQLEDNCLVID
jgi:hypothetical protein